MMRLHALLLTGALGLSGYLCGPVSAQTRVFRPADLPPAFRDRLAQGSIVRVSPTGAEKVAPAAQVTLKPGELLAVRTGEVAVHKDSLYRLPFSYLGLPRAGEAPLAYRPVYLLQGPLRYRRQSDDFVGTLLLGLEDSTQQTSRELDRPVRMRFAGDADSITPGSLELRRTNADMDRIQVFSRAAVDSVHVLIVPAFDPRGVGVWLPIEPALVFEQPPAGIQGLGVESATLVVGARGIRSRDSVPVTLSISHGSLETNRIFVKDGGAVVKLRSAGLGPATVTARVVGWQPAEATITYQWPIVFLAASLLGGALGAVVASLQRKSRASLGRTVLKGVLIGLVVCAVYFGIGVNLLQFDVKIQFFNEIAVFALSALAAMFGIPALSGSGRAPQPT